MISIKTFRFSRQIGKTATVGLWMIFGLIPQNFVYAQPVVKQWTRQPGTSADDGAKRVVTDSSGNIYVTGFTNGGLDGNTNQGGGDIFLIKYDSSGKKIWTRQLGTNTNDEGWGITTDSSGNIYVAGFTNGGLDGNTYQGGADIVLIKYDSSGSQIWTRQFGTS